jgi:LysR family hydrogen peroxide-inducible transcriptional activator
VTLCWRLCFRPVSVERASQLAMVQELVSLGHGLSMIADMARRVDQSDRRVYRSISGKSRRVLWPSCRIPIASKAA